MESKKNSVSSNDTDISQQEIINNSENKDNKESCIEKASEEDTESKELKSNEDSTEGQKNTEELHDELHTHKETTTATSEKDSIPNMETNDHATCLETTITEDSTSSEKPSEKNIEVAIPQKSDTIESFCEKSTSVSVSQENNTIESSCEESISININKETTELTSNISNLTKTCDIENFSSNISHKDANNTANDCSKSSKDNVVSKLESSTQEKDKDCDIPNKINANTDDVQMSQKEPDFSDSNLENSDKDCSQPERNIEPENTEFVQISHEKQDDTQIESHSMDAEDPFGGDNLASENVEQMEVDDLAEGEVSFKNIYEQDNNLQDVVTVKGDKCNEKFDNYTSDNLKDTVNKVVENIVDAQTNIQTTINSLINTQIETSVTNVNTSKTNARTTSSVKLADNQDEQAKKNIEEVTPMETDVDQTDVLPGQDDELCIIPDSMKVIIPDKSVKVIETEQREPVVAQDFKCDETAQNNKKSDSDVVQDNVQDEIKSIDTENTSSSTESAVTIENQDMETSDNVVKTMDVINIDDESKNSEEIEEIAFKEICKQCNEERVCKIRVKIGSENYSVCSKTCKALFKAANNKSVDIPSGSHLDGSSKRDKRCATCLLIIDSSDERNLSWETMEFCNEECLGKFQRKYGSYCKNCNGTVQPVSLGKYCVRFGCDVRQFCCSTCLEEFKKGLKVCSYCQKDISLSTDGFLAPVGEKGQFKDFCTQDCMEKYSKLNSTEPPTTEKKPCSVCQEV